MFKKKSATSETNFWISYADLMAGLLFVFILLIGAIVLKSSIVREQLNAQKNILIKQEEDLKNQKHVMNEQEDTLEEQTSNLLSMSQQIQIKNSEIANLNQLLLAQNSKLDNYSEHIVLLQNLTEEQNRTINSNSSDLNKYKNKILLLSNQLTQKDESLKLNDEKLLKLLKALENKKTKYDELLAQIQSQKAKIKSLTGIKLKVIAELKASLGDKINIDKKNGSLRLASNILFDKGSAKLKEAAKAQLAKNFVNYISALIENKNIAPHIDKIIIEGHSDSDGSYLYNLNLSQQRAYAVMNYLLTLDYIKRNNIKSKLVASGRSYLDVIKVNGKEDKDASRRIEVKFRLKNEDAMYEIERILDAD